MTAYTSKLPQYESTLIMLNVAKETGTVGMRLSSQTDVLIGITKVVCFAV